MTFVFVNRYCRYGHQFWFSSCRVTGYSTATLLLTSKTWLPNTSISKTWSWSLQSYKRNVKMILNCICTRYWSSLYLENRYITVKILMVLELTKCWTLISKGWGCAPKLAAAATKCRKSLSGSKSRGPKWRGTRGPKSRSTRCPKWSA